MKFPNAHRGVGTIFIAEILSVISFAALFCGMIFGIAAAALIDTGAAESAAGITLTLAILFAVFLAGSAVLILVSFILSMIGIVNAKKDEPAFGKALAFAIVGIAGSVVSTVFSKNTVIVELINVVVQLASLFVTLYVLEGIVNLAKQLGDDAMAEKGGKLRLLEAVVFTIPAVISLVSAILAISTENVVSNVLMLVASVVSLVAYFIYLNYLGKAKKMLEA